ncbi:MAG: hypothetical protein LBB65_01655 [Burkholderiales bacterium]|nr:hypothetical protein [Burkholderiales bacterium]
MPDYHDAACDNGLQSNRLKRRNEKGCAHDGVEVTENASKARVIIAYGEAIGSGDSQPREMKARVICVVNLKTRGEIICKRVGVIGDID